MAELIHIKWSKDLSNNFYFRVIQLEEGDEVTGCDYYKINTSNEVPCVKLYSRILFFNY